MRHRRSGRQLLAAFTTAPGQDRPTSAGPHPQPEAVGLGTATVIRLESALAHAGTPWLGVISAHLGGRAGRPLYVTDVATPSQTWRPRHAREPRAACGQVLASGLGLLLASERRTSPPASCAGTLLPRGQGWSGASHRPGNRTRRPTAALPACRCAPTPRAPPRHSTVRDPQRVDNLVDSARPAAVGHPCLPTIDREDLRDRARSRWPNP